MLRTMSLLLVGGLAGIAAVYLVRSSWVTDSAVGVHAADDAEPNSSITERLPVDERMAQATDPAELHSMIRAAAAEPASLLRTMVLETLFGRLVELDPSGAVRIAQSLPVEELLLVSLYQAWARADAGATLAELSRLPLPAAQRAIGLALLEVFGNDRDGIERVAAALPESGRLSFKLDALVARAKTDSAAALEIALAEDDPAARWFIVSRLASALAEVDPHLALAQASLIGSQELRQLYASAVLGALADGGPEAVLAFLETANLSALSGMPGILNTLARNEPELVLALVDRLPPAARSGARQVALLTLAERDPVAAAGGLESVPPGQSRSLLLSAIAQAYGQRSPDAALAWARTLSPRSPEAIGSVLRGIAAGDFDRALELAAAEIEQQGGPSFVPPPFIVLPLIESGQGDTGQVLNRLLEIEIDDAQMHSTLHAAMSAWIRTDHAAATEWALANGDRIEPQIVRMLALEDPAAAMRTLDRVGADDRAGWIAGIAAGLARSDLDGAMSFVDRQRGEPGYEAGLNEVLHVWAEVDPARAARLFDDIGGATSALEVTPVIAGEWAEIDPQAAASWVLALSDEGLRTSSVGSVTATWARQDPESARRWLLALQNGPARDEGLSSLLRAGAMNGTIDTLLLDAYSSDISRQQGMVSALLALGATDPGEARRLMEVHVTDPRLRELTESILSSTGGSKVVPQIIF